MWIIYIHEEGVLELQQSVVAIGAFDGVHKGHQAVIRSAVEKAKELEVVSVVYTFDPPPRSYFQGARVLTTLPERLHRFNELGVQHVVVVHFDESYVTRQAHCFIQELQRLHPIEICVGEDFRFGKNREGDLNLLADYFTVSIVEAVCCEEGERISSTRIRDQLFKGELKRSHSLLGWPIETM
ncbi:adenylyltransferase/cytidyltransferase family protein [Bacillus sp. DX1.1]|uniref:adenylyltransferase/cytidyltransferase family protein n=1 Tax=unclassified Bacillus (in: firmicutes) TaxID=185979 RepID=UPI0025710808|nr:MULTISPECIES: adenylyltransferase/cytidyltransferase family protein [unclassified Bacillus (in: firmicutes)]MDM5154615.1 adenylyltransferase/cytidyltransferase family protein [Bacillus sp. DX1.1]WJE83507.1 adenylyltransferase/cytidyltransferase family protein [Bacillus sp. DX3.1]